MKRNLRHSSAGAGQPSRRDTGKPLRAAPKLKLETGAFDEDVRAADLLQEYGAKISTLERMVDLGGDRSVDGPNQLWVADFTYVASVICRASQAAVGCQVISTRSWSSKAAGSLVAKP